MFPFPFKYQDADVTLIRCLCIVAILCAGDPDLLDALIGLVKSWS